jgi:hypothetical protein
LQSSYVAKIEFQQLQEVVNKPHFFGQAEGYLFGLDPRTSSSPPAFDEDKKAGPFLTRPSTHF